MENNFTKPKPTYVLDGGRAAAMGIAVADVGMEFTVRDDGFDF
jgi:hypothetical protein